MEKIEAWGFQEPGVVPPPAIFYQEVPMPEMSLFVSESGESGTESKYYVFGAISRSENIDVLWL